MTDLLVKLNYKRQERIAIINAEQSFMDYVTGALTTVRIDQSIDPRYPYSFIILFVKSISEVRHLTPAALHNLTADGILWFCYPKKSSKKYKTNLDRDRGWDILEETGFRGVRIVSVDDDWSAVRFRNVKYIRSAQDR